MSTKKKRNPIASNIKETELFINGLVSEIIDLYWKYVGEFGERKAILKAFAEVGFESKLSESIASEAAVIITGKVSTALSPSHIRKWYLSKKWRGQDLNLSTQIHNVTARTKAEIIQAIRVRMRASKSWQSVARGISKVGATKGDLPKYINKLLDTSRVALAGDKVALKEYRVLLRKAQSNIDKLSVAGNTDRLKKAYQNLIDKSISADTAQTTKAIDRAISAKINYNSQRVARTEIARAYGIAQGEVYEADDDVVGIEWSVSSAHINYDICDVLEGVYPKEEVPSYPAHPGCTCQLLPVYRKSKNTERFSKTNMADKIGSLSKQHQKEILGLEGMREFSKNKSSWQENLRNWEGVRPLTGSDSVPKS